MVQGRGKTWVENWSGYEISLQIRDVSNLTLLDQAFLESVSCPWGGGGVIFARGLYLWIGIC